MYELMDPRYLKVQSSTLDTGRVFEVSKTSEGIRAKGRAVIHAHCLVHTNAIDLNDQIAPPTYK